MDGIQRHNHKDQYLLQGEDLKEESLMVVGAQMHSPCLQFCSSTLSWHLPSP